MQIAYGRHQLHQFLCRQIDVELEKQNPDMEFIDECNILLNKIEGGVYKPDKKRMRQEQNKLYEAYRRMHGKHIFRPQKRLVISACAALLVILLTLAVTSAAGITPNDFFANFGRKLFGMNTGESIVVENMIFTKLGETKEYKNIKECVIVEKLDIYYPSWLPEETYISYATVIAGENGNEITLKTNNNAVEFYVYTYPINNMDNIAKELDSIITEDITAYYKVFKGYYYTVFELEGYQYSFSATDYETTKNILTGLRKDIES